MTYEHHCLTPNKFLLEILQIFKSSFLFRLLNASQIIVSQSGYDIAMIKVNGVIDMKIYRPICLPDNGWLVYLLFVSLNFPSPQDNDFLGRMTVVTG